jgi:hypothetical protein
MDVSAFSNYSLLEREAEERLLPKAADNLSGGIGRMPDEKTRQRMREVIRNLTL